MAADIMPDFSHALVRARAHAPFLSRALDRLPDLEALLAAGNVEQGLALALAAGEGIDDIAIALRRERLALALVIAIGDLAGAFPLARVITELSAFADRSLDAAIAAAIRRRTPDAPSVGFSAIALGKHGAQELNYSSDIDPILLYDPETLPRRERDDPAEAAQRIARTIMQIMSEVTDEGYVFRVDLRLRPASEVSPLALPFEAAITHYESSALAWERAAYIRARAASGDIAAGQAFLDTIRPFVWRRSLDFGAIAEIGRLTTRIRDHYSSGQAIGPGYDLKRGRGGIREVEFFAQTHQLIHGGRNPALRLRGTRASLDALAEAGIISTEDAAVMGQSYDRLRTLEHRLQMVGDQQTHSLPQDAQALDAAAKLDGIASGADLVAELTSISEAVGSRFDTLIATYAPTGAVVVEASPLGLELETLGFEQADALAERITAWEGGQYRCLRSAEARDAFARIRPHLLRALAQAPDPERALLRWEHLLAGLPSAINVFRLLDARPGLLALVMRILAHAPVLADELARRSDLLDTLIDRSAFDLPGSVAEIAAELARGEAGDDYQRLLDNVRVRVGEMRFALGVQLIEGSSETGGRDPLEVAAALSRVAEAAIEVLGRAAIDEFMLNHGVVPGSDLAILGLGRLGGAALTHASDLDLVFLFSGDHAAESDGRRPLGATLYYNRLAQRVIAALSVPTAAGALFEVDTRLRPSGAQGPISVSLESFERYQCDDAWTWEHMALCRARPLFGTAADRAALSTIIARVQDTPRAEAKLRSEVLEMRGTMAEHKPPKGPLDVKLARGGLVDIEFMVHFLQLRDHVARTPDLGQAVQILEEQALLPNGIRAAHDLLARLLVVVRLVAPDGMFPPPASRSIVARACGLESWDALLDVVQQARHCVALAWGQVFDIKLEID
ncbi:MAG: bifunctional glutamine synthetase adenylyltransferase/deadenyltransferase [Novosphingobium sp. 28-62-57]|uniref:bifunctional [glutamate--ammonia ligase]-adenylyl-L-tyrosine phosphorylase/[glutamate--ammonia-ligase] adenylyltransferase n=1 Tax=Novosphingobium sp. 28-62-57 TaxID=1970409 RepID=UPI000BCF860A|nr:bifunctional [glutamate--ammonia ligase]-adenylyl-L-tyrosine phosphorylase/[glutamate--ammonia-ligase] adenylyltransferase [Novosphingobium sp. 28-62-57]OYZ08183.1 MAG: bifunctional glutamine synthetase adenylyltransferase/deadenyltransferase [Novosphingobium sp. 28-62-57]OZA36137.1 MAG: bifunctional glutamine synthetase adenylyltransferase/deadenyltransferase [Novosphingobium sp. 17-62-9]